MIKRFLMYLYQYRFIRFAFIGGIGFIVNVCILYALRHEIGLMPARVVSYVMAVSTTWFLNRCFTFNSENPRYFREWLKYLMIYIVSGCINIYS